MWQASEDFFKQPQASKRAIKRTESSPLGYFDQEMTKRQRDLKEVFDFMRPTATGRNLNQWPDDEAFKQTLSDFFEAASSVAHRTLTKFSKDSNSLSIGTQIAIELSSLGSLKKIPRNISKNWEASTINIIFRVNLDLS